MNYVEFLQGVAIATLAIVGALSSLRIKELEDRSWRIKKLEDRVFLVENRCDRCTSLSDFKASTISYNPRGKSSTGSDGSGESQ